MTDLQSHGWLDGLQEAVWLVDETHHLILHANTAAERLVAAVAHHHQLSALERLRADRAVHGR